MSLLDRTAIDPTLDDLLGALTQADLVSGERLEGWRGWLAETLARPEGHKGWAGWAGHPPRNTRVEAVWWTDWVGRRHTRLLAWQPGRSLPTHYNLPGRSVVGEYPAAGAIYPGWVSVRRSREGTIDAVAACNCGAAGTLAQLAWMGPHCGPCHDRSQDRDQEGPRTESCHYLLRFPRDTVSPPTFSRDGKYLALAMEEAIQVREVWTGREEAHLEHDGAIRILGFSPDARFLLAVGEPDRAGRCRVHGWDLGTRAGIPLRRIDHEVRTLCFSPNGRRLALSWGGGLEVWNLVSRRNWRLDYSDGHSAEALAFDAEGNRLLVGSADRAGLIDLEEKRRHPIEFPRGERLVIHDVAFDPRGEPVLLTLESPRWSGQGVFRLREGKGAGPVRLALESRTEEISECQAHLTRDSRRVAVRDRARGTLRFWETETGSWLGELWWCGRNPHQLVLSPHDDLLATVDFATGTVRLWPWRDLLGLAP